MVQPRKSSDSSMSSVMSFLSRISPFAGQNEDKPWEGLSRRLSSIFRRNKAEWIFPFLSASYFANCEKHSNIKENSRKYFCTECPESEPICKTCKLEDHAGHMCLKLSRYSTSGAVRGSHSGCIDASDVYPYISRRKSSYFLRSDRPKVHPRKCLVCHRILSNRKVQIPIDSRPKYKREMRKVQRERNCAKYCSLECKFDDLLRCGKPLDAFINKKFDYRDYRTDSDSDDEEEDSEDDQNHNNNIPFDLYSSDDEDEEVAEEDEEEDDDMDDTAEENCQQTQGSEENLGKNDKRDEEKQNNVDDRQYKAFTVSTKMDETAACKSISMN